MKWKLTRLEWFLIILVIFTLCFPSFRDYYTKVLIDMPISISPPGIIETDVYVPFEESYEMVLRINKNEENIGQVLYVVGSGSYQPIKPMSFEVNVYSVPDMKLVVQKAVSYANLLQWKPSSNSTTAHLGITLMDLVPGNYRLSVKLLTEINVSPSAIGAVELFGGGWDHGKPIDSMISGITFDSGKFELEKDILLTGKGNYLLKFNLSDEETQLRNAIGGGFAIDKKVGTPLPLNLEIYSLPDKKLVHQREITTYSMDASSRDFLARHIDYVRLPKGNYRFIIKVTEDVPAFKPFEVSIHMGLGGKFSSSTWQMTLIIFGNLLYPVVLALDAILFIFACYKRFK